MVKSGFMPGSKTAVCCYNMDGILKKNFDEVIKRVRTKNWDYVCIVSGLPGSGKSNFAQNCARFLCSWFDHTYIAFSDKDFIRITNECPEYSSVILDESFQSLNTRVSNSTAFLRIINHLQLIRQKHLFIFLCLPNFFDLSKGVAIFRSSHLFYVYATPSGDRGRFCAFSRENKRELYIRGLKFLNYNVVRANFHGRFPLQKCVDNKIYDAMKRKHLLSQGKKEIINKDKITRNKFIKFLKDEYMLPNTEIAKVGGLNRKTIYSILLKEDADAKD